MPLSSRTYRSVAFRSLTTATTPSEQSPEVLGTCPLFTYVHAGILDGSAGFPEAARWMRNVDRAGEPWIFGLLPEGLDAFLRDRGWTLESDVSTREAGDRWFPALGRRDRGSALYHVAVVRSGPCPG